MQADLTTIAHRKAEGWRRWRISQEPLLDDGIRACLIQDQGDLTLGELDALSDDVLVRSANIGSKSKRLIRAMLLYWRDKEAKEIEDRAKTVRWEDGDFGSEFITPEEYHRRTQGQPIFPSMRTETHGAGLGESGGALCRWLTSLRR